MLATNTEKLQMELILALADKSLIGDQPNLDNTTPTYIGDRDRVETLCTKYGISLEFSPTERHRKLKALLTAKVSEKSHLLQRYYDAQYRD